ncbi:MAG: DUF5658 family protein [Candidatus Aminicenantes bacterium]
MTADRRQLKDRRAKPTPALSRYSVIGRRREKRRLGEDENYYVDRYETHYLVLIVSILALCLLDVYFTLNLLQLGAEELNPFMSLLIKKEPVLSLVLKYLVTAGSLIVLLLHKNFRIFGRLKAYSLIYGVFSLYFLLMLYEIYFFITHRVI